MGRAGTAVADPDAVRRDGAAGLSLVFAAGSLLCALPLEDVIETIRPLPVQPLAGTPDFVLGVGVIRGMAVPVVDIARLLGDLEFTPSRFVATRTDHGPIAFATGAVIGVRDAVPDAGRPLPPILGAAASRLVAAVGVLDAQPLLFLHSTWMAAYGQPDNESRDNESRDGESRDNETRDGDRGIRTAAYGTP